MREIERTELVIEDAAVAEGLQFAIDNKVGLRPQMAVHLLVNNGYQAAADWLQQHPQKFAQAMCYGIITIS